MTEIIVEPRGTEEPTVNRQAVSALRNAGKPIVLEYKKSKKKKDKRYSKGLEDVQRIEGRVSRVGKSVSKAIAEGASTYEKERKTSARKKRDGAIQDFVPNVGEAMSVTLREVSSVPADMATAVNTKGTRRLLKNQLRMASNTLRIWRDE